MQKLNIKDYFKNQFNKLKTFAQAHSFKLGIIDATDPHDIGNQIYIKRKVEDFNNVGWEATVIKIDDVEKGIAQAKEEGCNGIIVQLPTRPEVEFNNTMIPAEMDCDGLRAESLYDPATARGIIDYLEDCDFCFKGARVLVIGRSEIVGRPVARMLTDKDATVTLCHSKSDKNHVLDLLWRADLVIIAVGVASAFSRKQCPNAIVIDVGINRTENGICGDFVEMEEYCSGDVWSTPVPGGVGLLTRLGLMKNCQDIVSRNQSYKDLP